MNLPASTSARSRPASRTVLGSPLLRRRNRLDAADTLDSGSPENGVVALFPQRESPEMPAVVDLERALEFVAQGRALLLRAEDEDSVCKSICDAALETGDYAGAWIARADADGALQILAVRGNTPGLPASPARDASDAPASLQSARLAMRELRSAVFCSAPTLGRGTSPNHRPAELGLAMPIQVRGEAWGVLVLYARHGNALDAQEIKRLNELTADLGYRLGTLCDHKERSVAEKTLRQSNRELAARICQQTAELSRTTRELDAIRYTIAHDLRAPLRSIDGFAHMLNVRYAPQLDATARGYLERVRRAAQRLGAIIDHTLDLAHLANIRPQLGDVNLSALAQDICVELGHTETPRQLQISIEPGLVAHADVALMRVALRHLFENAFEHTRLVAAAAIEFGAAQGQDGRPYFFVRDNGIGFDMRHSARLFKAFSRLSGNENSSRMGVGLATVARIIERHGGTVWATSSIGEGATFCFTLGTAGSSPRAHE